MRAIVFANGTLNQVDDLPEIRPGVDLIVAADGARVTAKL